jgi:hypothetical protein
MTVEKADLSVSLSLERMVPVAPVPAVQGQSSPRDGEGKPRRRPPPPEETSVEPSEDDSDRPHHRIDSLA